MPRSIRLTFRDAFSRAILETTFASNTTGRQHMNPPNEWTTRLVVGHYPDRRFDLEFWQEQGDEAIFSAAWEMIELAEEMKHGRKPELQRTVTTLKRMSG